MNQAQNHALHSRVALTLKESKSSAVILPFIHAHLGDYELRQATHAHDVEAIQRLRFEVFNLELNEGLESSRRLGRDQDVFDTFCNHLLVTHKPSGAVVGTYRMMTWEHAQSANGFYSANEFALGELPEEILREALEVGRACVQRDHRNGSVIRLLWKGLAQFASHLGKRYLFGCCSIPGTCADNADQWLHKLIQADAISTDFVASVQPAFFAPPQTDLGTNVSSELAQQMPALMKSYLRLGGKICGGPAVDRAFGVTDFLLFLDLQAVDPRVRNVFLGA